MKRHLSLSVVVLAGAALCLGAGPLSDAKQMRQERSIDRDHYELKYRFEPDAEHVTPAERAAARGARAAKAWLRFKDSGRPLAAIARSPYGGGETAKSYWPADIKAELLRKVAAPLAEAGLRPVMPDLPEEKPAAGDKPKPIRRRVDKDNPLADLDLDVKRAAQAGPPKPWPKLGFSEDYEFVLVVGLHHEPVPHRSTRRRAGGEVVYFRSSRMTAWAILFRCKTRTAFWGATTVAKVGYQGVADPPNVAAETALGYLDFSKIGEDNIPDEVKKLSPSSELRAVDLAAMLVQTQRADAVAAVIKTATSKSAYKTSAPVMRYFSARGAPLDFRTDPASAKRRRQALASQRVMVRLLLIEQLRGVRGVQACLLTAGVPRVDDLEIGRVGQYQCGLLEPLNADDEVVLISELANGDRRRAFARNHVAAVKNLGKCRHYIDEAMAVARTYAERKPPPPRQGGRRRRDYLKEAGQQALAQLRQAKAQQKKAKPAEVEDLDLPDW